MARIPLRPRTPEAPPPADWRRLLARAVAHGVGVAPVRLGRLERPARPLDPGATLADVRQLVRPLGLDAVEVALSPEEQAVPAWPVVGVRRADAAPVAVVPGRWGRPRWRVSEADRLQTPGPPDALEAVGYAVFPRDGVALPVPGSGRLHGAALALGGLSGAAAQAPNAVVVAGLGAAVLAGVGLLDAAVQAAEARRRLSTGAPRDEAPEVEGPMAWCPDRIVDPAAGLRSSVVAVGALGLAASLGAGLPPGPALAVATWALVAWGASVALQPLWQSREEVSAGALAAHLLAAVDDVRLAGVAERQRQAWLRRHARALGAVRSRQRRARLQTVALALMAGGAAWSLAGTSGVGLTAGLAGVAAGWSAGRWVWRRPRPSPSTPAPPIGPGSGAVRADGLVLGQGEARLVVPALDVPDGALVVIAGPPESGKSRLLRAILGLERPVSGTITLGGRPLTAGHAHTLREGVAVLPQARPLPAGDVAAVVLGDRLETEPARAAWPVLDAVGLGDAVRALPMGLMALVAEGGGGFSGGERRRLGLARALASGRPLLLLDEPLAGLDPAGRRAAWDAIRRHPATRVVVTRDVALATSANLGYVIVDGVVRLVGRAGV